MIPPAEAPAQHGGPQEAELRALGVDADAVLDFSSSTNPYGPEPALVQALLGARIDRYPDPTALRAREALGARCGAAPGRVVLGNGAAELLWVLARCLLAPGTAALIVEPTFSEFRCAARQSGARLLSWRARPEQRFRVELPELSRLVEAEAPRVAYLCAPNTPTGTGLPASEIAAWAARHPALTLLLDQSFLALSERWADAAVPMPENVVLVRSLTKEHGIPGVRVGYLIATAERCAQLEASRPAWSTSAFAQAAAIACSSSERFVRESRERLLDDRRQLEVELAALGIETSPSEVNFLLARVPRASALRTRLLCRHQLLVRDCASFGLSGFLRFAARPPADRARLISALRAEAR